MTTAQASTYDEVPYESSPFPYTHPDALATVATLFGMTPPSIERCRVLEIGCAGGGNLIPMALGLPEGRFVGIDLSPRQIGDGQAVLDKLQLANVELRAMDLLELDSTFGQFDYIICHGVYSWAPRPVQDKILSICSQQLSPQGVAYISYNTYPGWHSRGMVRQMVRYHADPSAQPLEQVRLAREFLEFMIKHSRDPKSVYNFVLQEEAKIWEKGSDSYLLHEQLAEFNEPLYFHQFISRLADSSLQFIAEAQLSDTPWLMAEELQEKLAAWCDDLVRYEQYLDFLRERTFRRSLVCHEQVVLNRSPGPELICKFFLAARAMPVSEQPEVASTKAEQFRTHDGITFSTNNPWLKAALVSLFDYWPRMLSFEELCELAHGKLGTAPEAELDPFSDAKLLKQPLLQCGRSGMLELHVRRSPDFAGISETPRASPLARLQAEQGPFVTNLRHRQMELREFDRQVLQRLDGKRDREALARSLAEAGVFDAHQPDETTPGGRADDPPRLDELLYESLRRLAGGGLLVG